MKFKLKIFYKLFFFGIFFLISSYSVCECADIGSNKKKIYMVHWVNEGRLSCGQSFIDYFKEKYPDVEIIEREAKQSKDNLKKIVEEIKKIKPNLIYIYSTTALIEIAGTYDAVDPTRHITDIPIITVGQSEPVLSKVIKEIGKPTGRNVSGVGQHVPANLSYKMMQQYTGNLKKIIILCNKFETNSIAAAQSLRVEVEKQNQKIKIKANQVKCEIVFFDIVPGKNTTVVVPGSIEKTVLNILDQKPDMVFMTSDTINTNLNSEIINNFIKYKSKHAVPIFTTLELQVTRPNSCTFAYFTSFSDMGLLAAKKAEQVLDAKEDIKKVPYDIGHKMSLVIRQDTMNASGVSPLISLLEPAEILVEEKDKHHG